MNKHLKTIALSLFVLLLLERFTHSQTGGFRPYKIRAEKWMACDERMMDGNERSVSDEANEILKQRFYFLDQGAQFYVFISADGQSVLKFVKYKPTRPSERLGQLTGNHRRQKKRLAKVFESFRIVERDLKDKIGLIAYQLNYRTDEKKPLVLVDNIGISHTINLNETSFILQRKATDFFEGFNGREKQTIDDLLALIKNHHSLQIINEDPCLKNFGFVDGILTEIDCGSYIYDERYDLKKHLLIETHELKKWLNKNNLNLSNYLTKKYEET